MVKPPRRKEKDGKDREEGGTTETEKAKKKCKKFACAFQYCLNKHNHSIDKCRGHYEEFERCTNNNNKQSKKL